MMATGGFAGSLSSQGYAGGNVAMRPINIGGPSYSDPGIPCMTSKALRDACTSNNGYEAPELNNVLLLAHKGFRKIENLEKYTEVKSLFLECNGLRQIENLGVLRGLKSLYLQQNVIERIEGLDCLVNLQYLNLAHNAITRVENLGGLKKLETLNLAANKIVEVDALQGLLERPSLKSVDVSQNYIEDAEPFVSFWAKVLPEVECLYLHHNPCSRFIKDYRRKVISSLQKLRWLDDRPVTERERCGSEAWLTGGKEAALEAERAHFWRQKEANDRSFEAFRRVQEVTAERATSQREEQAAQSKLREVAAKELASTGTLSQGWHAVAATRSAHSADAACEEDASATPASTVEARHAALKARVGKFLEKRRPPPPPEDEDATTAEPQTADEASGDEGFVADLGDSSANSGGAVSSTATATAAAEEEDGQQSRCEVEEFVWNKFRDSRLGRLVAEFRYNYDKAAAALREEFDCPSLETQECRRRYKELLQPRPAAAASGDVEEARRRIKEDNGRAKDGPPPDQQVVDDYSAWWLRRLKHGPSTEEVAAKQEAKKQAEKQPARVQLTPASSLPSRAPAATMVDKNASAPEEMDQLEVTDGDIAASWQSQNWARRYAAENFAAGAGGAGGGSDASMVAGFSAQREMFSGQGEAHSERKTEALGFSPPARSAPVSEAVTPAASELFALD
eukprot:TRINITY_DN34162_c0_g1_i2.p1 TRINITY_DN34162_c0_g1~~TRINITY_DN34162_c0_g1_i2.p1  ORF type:complete len:683 (+),score=226.86 TRINITY_DN34162_c0_g1_i2:95-2143(+)